MVYKQAGYSSVGRASDCRMLQQSDGPWFDSGWPDLCGLAAQRHPRGGKQDSLGVLQRIQDSLGVIQRIGACATTPFAGCQAECCLHPPADKIFARCAVAARIACSSDSDGQGAREAICTRHLSYARNQIFNWAACL